MVHITNREKTDYLKTAELADVYSLIHRPQPGEGKATSSIVRSRAGSTHTKNVSGQGQLSEKSVLVCRFCRKEGHMIKDCPDPRCKVSKSTSVTASFTKPVAATNLPDSTPVDYFQSFRSSGTVAMGPGKQQHPIQIIRDTASAQSLIHKAALPDIDSNLTGDKVHLQLVNAITPVRLAKVELDCEVVKGTVIVGVIDSPLPIPNATFLLGNDLAGSLVVPALAIRDTPLP